MAESFDIRRLALPAFGPSLLFGIGEGAILPILVLSAMQLVDSVAVAATMVALLGVGSLLTNIPASIFTTRFGEKRAIVAASVVGASGMLICMLAEAISVLAAGIFIVGMSAAVFKLARLSYLTEAVPVPMRARALSTLGGVMRIGVFAGPFLGAGAIHLMNIGGAYLVGAAALCAAGILAGFMPDLPATGGVRSPSASLPVVVRNHSRAFLTIGTGIAMVNAVRACRQVIIPLWAAEIGLDAATAVLIFGLSGAIDMLIFYPAGKVMDTKGRLAVAIPSMLVMGAAFAIVPLTSGFTSLLCAALILGFGNGIGSGLVMTLGADASPKVDRAKFLGVWRLLSDCGASSGPLALAGMTALFSLPAGIWLTSTTALVAAATLWKWVPSNRNK